MRRRILLLVPALALAIALAIPTPGVAATNARVTTDGTAGSYLRYDGSSDATMAACSTGLRAQNEPAVAVDPHNTNVVVSGANDY